jgi:hypothetical protein
MLKALVVLLIVFCCFTSPANATTISFQFDSTLQTGALTGTQFTGTASFDNAGSTGVGIEYLFLTSLNFTLDGETFTRADIDQGGQAVLENGTLSYFTAAFFPEETCPSCPIDDIAFGFGGPGVIGYSVSPGFNPGLGAYVIETPVPEPSTLSLSVMGLLAWVLLFHRGSIAGRRRWMTRPAGWTPAG